MIRTNDMRIYSLNTNDIADCDDGLCVSLWFQGCPHKCKGCHNPQTWDFNGGTDVSLTMLIGEIKEKLLDLKNKTGKMTLSLLGGEPLCPENVRSCSTILTSLDIDSNFSDLNVICWSGYYYDELKQRSKESKDLKYIIDRIDTLIDGRFILEKRNTNLKLRGSENQSIYRRKHYLFGLFSKLIKCNN